MVNNPQQQRQQQSAPQETPGQTALRYSYSIAIVASTLIFTVVLIISIIGGAHDLLAYGKWLVLAFVVLALAGWQGPRINKHIQDTQDQKSKRERENKLNDAQVRHLDAKTKRLEETLPFDDQGNLFAHKYGYIAGQYREHPALTNYHNAPRIHAVREVQEQQQAALPPVQQPSQDWILSQLPASQLVVSPGVRRSNGELVRVKIEEVPHIKIIGAPGFGKSCLAGSFLDQLTQLNQPDKLQLALLDIEHKTSRLYEHLPHIYEPRIGKRRVPLVGTNAEEVAEHLRFLAKSELAWRGSLPEDELDRLPVVLAYIEEMYALQLEDIPPELMKRMVADVNILAARGRKYRVFLLAAMQTDYATEDMRNVQKMFRLRNAAAIDTSAARAAGFMNTELIKENFKNGQFGQFVTEFPGFSDIVYAPAYDVKRLLLKQNSSVRMVNSPVHDVFTGPISGDLHSVRTEGEQDVNNDEQSLQADVQKMIDVADLRAKGWGKIDIVQKLWNVKRGGSEKWKQAEREYAEIIQALEQAEEQEDD